MQQEMHVRSAEIGIRGLTKVFGEGVTAVIAISRADLVLEQGEFISLLGPPGCGKTTLMRIIAGPEAPTAG